MAELTARLDHVGLAVVDLGAACAWYCDVFGLVPELSLRVDAIELSIEMLIHPAFGYRVELLHRPGTGAGPGAGTGGADGVRRRPRGQPHRTAAPAREAPVNRILFVNGQVFDGTGTPAVPADVVVRGDRIESVRPGGGSVIEAAGSRAAEAGDQVIDCAGTTVMPGLVES